MDEFWALAGTALIPFPPMRHSCAKSDDGFDDQETFAVDRVHQMRNVNRMDAEEKTNVPNAAEILKTAQTLLATVTELAETAKKATVAVDTYRQAAAESQILITAILNDAKAKLAEITTAVTHNVGSTKITKGHWRSKIWRKIDTFFGHAFTVAVLGGILIILFQYIQWSQQEKQTRKEQLQDKQYTLLANFSGEFDEYVALLENVRYQQNFFVRCKTNRYEKDFIGRSRSEVLPIYNELITQMCEHPRGEAVLVSIKALYHSPNVTDQVTALDTNVLKLQYGDPSDLNMTDDQITDTEKVIDQQVRLLAVAMRREMEADR